MITWSYRVFREADGDFVIREVFYNEEGAILGCTANAVEPLGSSLEELAQSIDDFKAALDLPVLTLDDIPEPTQQPQHASSRTISHEELRARLDIANETHATHQP